MNVARCAKALALSLSLSLPQLVSAQSSFIESSSDFNFNRIATFAVCLQLDEHCNSDTETAAEIVSASTDGNTLIYSNSPNQSLGFVDISDPAQPKPLGELALSGEPTSVSVLKDWAIVAINTSSDYINVSGELLVVDIKTQSIVQHFDLGGQPDSIAVSPSGNYLGIAIENERDEDLEANDGRPNQLPAGEFIVVNTSDESPAKWQLRTVALTNLSMRYSNDPEPEFVDINNSDIAVLTLQENNHIALIDLKTAQVINHFSAGQIDLEGVDTKEEKPALISLDSSLSAVPREPDGVTWIDEQHFVTADEGDLDGGSRGFTIFNTKGEVVFSSGNSLDQLAVQLGHYPDARSKNKGNEPENAEFANYGDSPMLFVNSERSSLIFVYDVSDVAAPKLRQILPTAAAPEGVLAIPSRNLLVAASEKDDRGDKLRSSLNIYQYAQQAPSYPSVVSAMQGNAPIAWSAISALSSDLSNPHQLYAVNDSFYQQNQIFNIDASVSPAAITSAISINDNNDVLANLPVVQVESTLAADDVKRAEVFDSLDLQAMINADKSLNLDPEGIAVASDGGFWIASEGSGSVGDKKRPVKSRNLILKLSALGSVEKVYQLSEKLNAQQQRFGLEGISEYQGKLYFAMQRPWDQQSFTHIGVLDLASEQIELLNYPLDAAQSNNGGWVGISEISAIGDGQFLVLERDNQGGPDAVIKRIYQIDVNQAKAGEMLAKTLHLDLFDVPRNNALMFEKFEGMTLSSDGTLYVINDNDGLDDNSGETQLLAIKP